jgi:hypothetical protein
MKDSPRGRNLEINVTAMLVALSATLSAAWGLQLTPTPRAGVVQCSAVASWYDSGARLCPDAPPAPVVPAVAVSSWYDSGVRLTPAEPAPATAETVGSVKPTNAMPKPKEYSAPAPAGFTWGATY